MKKLPTRNALYRAIWTGDSFVSSNLFEVWATLKDWGSAYSSWLYRWFRMSGPKRYLVDIIDDAFTFGVAALFALLAFALPPFSGAGDIWNRGREYAITFTDQDGKVIGRRGIKQDDAIPLNEIPPALIKAVLATEDARFYDHFGVDVIGTLRALVHNSRGGSKQGGSSITQQVAKNLFLSPERTMKRKVNEAFLSMWIEARLPKNDILKLYLDRSYLGGGAYGVEAASQFYFGKSVRDINLPEAAVLAGLFKAPTQYAPHANPEAAKARSNVVLYRMLDAGFITQGELLQAQRTPAEIVKKSIVSSPNWFMDFAYEDTLRVIARQNLKANYVLEVKTTINSRLQEAAQAIMNDVIDTQGPDRNFSQGSSITMAPDGAVHQIVGGRDYEDSQFNRVTAAKRQVGSSFKPFVYLAALLKGYTPESIVVDRPVCVVDWCVHNFEPGYRGPTKLWNAMAHSVNTIAVQLMVEVGRKNVEALAHRMGITGKIDPYPTMAIGTSALTLMDLSTGYATIANQGKLAKPYAVLEIRKPNGDLLYSRDKNESEAEQIAPAEKIAELTTMMHAVMTSGTATASNLTYIPAAGKTGTNAGYKDAWFVGFTSHFVTGVWVGNDDNTPMNSTKELRVTGGRVPAPAWKRIMDVAEFGRRPEGMPGAPLDASYEAPLTVIADPVVGSLVGVASAAPAPVALQLASLTDGEVGDATGDESADPASKDVLNNMLDLFQTEDAAPAPVAPKAKPAKRQVKKRLLRPQRQRVARIVPPPPRRKTFFELLFGAR